MRDHPRSAVHDLICISCNGGRFRPPFCPFSPELPLTAATPQLLLRRPSSSQIPSDASLCIRSAKPIARRKACALGASRNPSPRRKRQASSISLLVLSELQTLRWFAIRFLYCALPRAILFNALFGRRIATIPIAYGSDKRTTRICGQTKSISFLLISGILGRLRCCTACGRGRCPHRPVCPVSPNCLFCGNTAAVPPAAYFFCCARKSRQKEALRPRKLHIPRPGASGRLRPLRCSSSPNCKRFAGLQFGSYIARSRARFLFNALFGRKIVRLPMAYGSDQCTTRSYRQTAIISLLFISGILGRLRCYTACCRGRCLHRPLQTCTTEREYCAPSAHT